MTTELELCKQTAVLEERRERAYESARQYANKSRSDSTWRTYESAWRVFSDWCRSMQIESFPAQPETVAMFIAAEADEGKAISTLEHRLSAIRLMHLGQGATSPHNTLPVLEVLRGVRRSRKRIGNAPNRKAPVLDADIKRLVDLYSENSIGGLRDRALLLYGFAGALRRSELVGIDVEHIVAHEKGHLLTIPFSKGDQTGRGQTIGILAQPESPYCPVSAMQRWLSKANIRSGAIFRRLYRSGKVGDKRLGDRSVAELIKDAVFRLKDPKLDYRHFSGHSLRRGFLTSAGRSQADLFKMIAQSRHTQIDTVLAYTEDTQVFQKHAAENLLLERSATIDSGKPPSA